MYMCKAQDKPGRPRDILKRLLWRTSGPSPSRDPEPNPMQPEASTVSTAQSAWPETMRLEVRIPVKGGTVKPLLELKCRSHAPRSSCKIPELVAGGFGASDCWTLACMRLRGWRSPRNEGA